jgi:hypothetical protein
VKHLSADDSAHYGCESRTPPTPYQTPQLNRWGVSRCVSHITQRHAYLVMALPSMRITRISPKTTPHAANLLP